jgi:hypothetical protein
MHRFTLPLVIAGSVALAALLTWLAVSTMTIGGQPPRPGTSEVGNGAAVTHALAPFSRIDVSGAARVELVQGDAESVTIGGSAGRRGRVSADVRDKTLYINSADHSRWWDLLLGRSRDTPQIVVNFRDVSDIAAAGTVALSAARISAPELKIAGAGGTSVRIDDLQTRQLSLAGAGALKAELAGTATAQTVAISGAGEYRGGKLKSQHATVNVAGAGKVIVNAEKTLKATISGAGSVEYYGDPQVTERVSGVGSVRRRDAMNAGSLRVADAF